MGEPSSRRQALSLLGEAYRDRRTGILSVEAGGDGVRVAVRDGQAVGICPPPGAPAPPADPFSDLDDSTRQKLEQILVEVGLRRPPPSSARSTSGPSTGELRQRLVSALADGGAEAGFDETAGLPEDALPTTGATELLILEAVRGMSDAEAIRGLLGDLDQALTPAPGLAAERTLTLTEGALLSHIDGIGTARELLKSTPLETDDAERGLAGLLLTGRVSYAPTPPRPAEEPDPAGPPPPGTEDPGGDAEPVAQTAGAPSETSSSSAPPSASPDPPEQMDAETVAQKEEIVGLFHSLSLLNHFEILGVEPGCSDADVRREYVARVKRYHPDAHRDAALADLHDMLEAIFIRVGEAWETLGNAETRVAYEARLGSAPGHPGKGAEPGTARMGDEEENDGSLDAPLQEAERLLDESRFWDAIQILEATVPRLEPQSRQHRGRILLARAYARNPKWIRRAEKELQGIVGEDPANAEAHYALGVLYKAGGLTARAQAMFRKAVELRPDHGQAAAGTASGEAPPGGLLRRLFGGGGKGA